MKNRRLKRMILNMLVGGLRFFYFFIKLAPVRHQVTLVSRQSDTPSLDFRLLEKALKKEDETLTVRCLCRRLASDSGAGLSYVPHLFRLMNAIARSEFVVTDGYSIPVSVLHHKKDLQIMQIWHACAAIKQFGLQTIGLPGGTDPMTAACLHMHENYDHIACSSSRTRSSFSKAFGYPEDRFVLLTLPRADRIRSREAQEASRKRLFASYPELASEKKNVCYFPTFRRGKPVDLTPLRDALDGARYNLVVHYHPLDPGSSERADAENAVLCGAEAAEAQAAPNAEPAAASAGAGEVPAAESGSIPPAVISVRTDDVYDLFSVADYIVTDYSSIAAEASLIDCPLYFYTFDEETYRKEVGLNVDYADEPVAAYAFRDAGKLADALPQPYDFDALHAFRDSFFEARVDGCAENMACFILDSIKKGRK